VRSLEKSAKLCLDDIRFPQVLEPRDVAQGAGYVVDRAVGILHHAHGDVDVNQRPILAAPCGLESRSSSCNRSPKDLLRLVTLLVGNYFVGEFASKNFTGAVAKNPLGAPAPEQNRAVQGGGNLRVRQFIDEPGGVNLGRGLNDGASVSWSGWHLKQRCDFALWKSPF
jgi:hypothetical protein